MLQSQQIPTPAPQIQTSTQQIASPIASTIASPRSTTYLHLSQDEKRHIIQQTIKTRNGGMNINVRDGPRNITVMRGMLGTDKWAKDNPFIDNIDYHKTCVRTEYGNFLYVKMDYIRTPPKAETKPEDYAYLSYGLDDIEDEYEYHANDGYGSDCVHFDYEEEAYYSSDDEYAAFEEKMNRVNQYQLTADDYVLYLQVKYESENKSFEYLFEMADILLAANADYNKDAQPTPNEDIKPKVDYDQQMRASFANNAEKTARNQSISDVQLNCIMSQAKRIQVTNQLSLKLSQRPSLNETVARGILLLRTDTNVDYTLQLRSQQLHRRKVSQNLAKMMRCRPTPDELELKGILKSHHDKEARLCKDWASWLLHLLIIMVIPMVTTCGFGRRPLWEQSTPSQEETRSEFNATCEATSTQNAVNRVRTYPSTIQQIVGQLPFQLQAVLIQEPHKHDPPPQVLHPSALCDENYPGNGDDTLYQNKQCIHRVILSEDTPPQTVHPSVLRSDIYGDDGDHTFALFNDIYGANDGDIMYQDDACILGNIHARICSIISILLFAFGLLHPSVLSISGAWLHRTLREDMPSYTSNDMVSHIDELFYYYCKGRAHNTVGIGIDPYDYGVSNDSALCYEHMAACRCGNDTLCWYSAYGERQCGKTKYNLYSFHFQDPLDQLSLFDELMVAPSEKQAACVPEILDTLQCHVIGMIFNTSIMAYVEENQSLLFDEHLTAVIPHCSFADGVHDVFDISHYNVIGILLLLAKVYVMELCINDALYVDLNDSKTDVIWIDKS
eukprot:76559_1